uniref:PH01B001G05.10 protein n=1 Tax=Phyllostachys edulis TaxID=38705 RepID=L0P2C0_PHYED|nr:PH01B001G05.10 [Phyllostachys edulis]
MYDRAFIEQKYILNYAMRAETFKRCKPYVSNLTEKAPEEPKKAGWWWRTPKQEVEYDWAEHATHKGKTPASETGSRPSDPHLPSVVQIEEEPLRTVLIGDRDTVANWNDDKKNFAIPKCDSGLFL